MEPAKGLERLERSGPQIMKSGLSLSCTHMSLGIDNHLIRASAVTIF